MSDHSEPMGPTHPCVMRAREQIRRGEALARERGMDRSDCVDAMHYLIPDGGAARQGDDPTALVRYGLHEMLSEAQRIEREAVLSLDNATFIEAIAQLRALGPTRAKDATRLTRIRNGDAQ